MYVRYNVYIECMVVHIILSNYAPICDAGRPEYSSESGQK